MKNAEDLQTQIEILRRELDLAIFEGMCQSEMTKEREKQDQVRLDEMRQNEWFKEREEQHQNLSVLAELQLEEIYKKSVALDELVELYMDAT